VAVASAGPYASLHLAPDRQPHQHPTTLFLQARCPSCRPTNSVKALKAQLKVQLNIATDKLVIVQMFCAYNLALILIFAILEHRLIQHLDEL